MGTRIFQVVVRGQFSALDACQRAALLEVAADHEIFRARYTAEGTLTYEPSLVAFSFRYEERTRDDEMSDAEAEEWARQRGMAKAAATLGGMGLLHKRLRATATNMATVTARS